MRLKRENPIVVFPEYHDKARSPLQEKIRKKQEVIVRMLELDWRVISNDNTCNRERLLQRSLSGEFGPLYEMISAKLTPFGYDLFRVCTKITSNNAVEQETREVALKIIRVLTEIGNETIL